ncbi:MAG: YkgJ family cysteine cluster protein [Planctomycetota bacterium]|nr:YkgJ family cysteine cluster protein [Planctomycetota bacterium]
MAKSRATCLASGRCCQFAAFGHRLYVTGLEAAIVLDAAREAGCEPTLDAVEAARARGSCPFLQGRACGIHAIRPIPCRAFFCDRHAGPEVAHAHETAHGELRGLHDALRVPYAYSEWTDHLSRLVGSTHGDIMES